jgi:uncharacterized membrane protein
MRNSRMLNQLARSHIRLWISILAASAAYVLLPGGWSAAARVLVSWNFGVLLFLGLIWQWMIFLPSDRMRARFEEADEVAGIILLIVILAALLSLVAIMALLTHLKPLSNEVQAAHLALAAITVVSSWTLVPTMFAIHYADRFYSSKPDHRPLAFPQSESPGFWDFAYFSFTIAVAAQTADVSTNTAAIRKVVIAHAIVSFIFNVSILGFAINVSAGLVSAN